ncbi:MAG TPA: hypothetical protein VEA41_18635 [Salinarimonas sp.]|nr:hypothetical protein [Salinarimonas sp.]
MTYTDEQLSMLLGEHDARQLAVGGGTDWRDPFLRREEPAGCLMQVILNEPNRFEAARANEVVADLFDMNYYEAMSPEGFLAFLADLP